MGSSCSSGQSKKDKEGKCKGSKKSKKGAERTPRGSNASNSSLYVYQPRAPTPPLEPQGDTSVPEQKAAEAPLTTEDTHAPASRSDSQPLSPTSPIQVAQSPKDAGTPEYADFPDISRPLLIGDIGSPAPRLKPRKIVLFLCADHQDTVTERMALVERVYKKVREHCASRGYELEVIDLHWGLGKMGLDDHSLRELCIRELHHYNRHCLLVPVVFLNETLGPILLPQKLFQDDWECLMQALPSDEDRQLMERWYILDSNAQLPYYRLIPISTWHAEHTSADGKLTPWQKEEKLLLELLQEYCTPEQAAKYLSTYLEDLVKEVITVNEQIGKQCIWITRKFIQRPTDFPPMEKWLQPRLEELHERLLGQVDESRALRFVVNWSEGLIDTENVPVHAQYVDDLCAQFHPMFVGVVDSIMDANEAKSPDAGYLGMERRVFHELLQQTSECQNEVQRFRGHEEIVAKIGSYITSDSTIPFILHGPPGCGKTAVVAKAIERCTQWVPGAPVVFRFVGLTPDSSTTEQILRSVCEQCCLLYGIHPSQASQNVSKLSKQWPTMLQKVSPTRPLIVFIDGLDQVQSYGSISVGWIPTSLFENLKLILTLRDGSLQLQELKVLISEESSFLEVPLLTGEDCMKIVEKILDEQDRTLTSVQKEAIKSSVDDYPLPLYAVMVANQACLWPSSLDQPLLTGNLESQMVAMFDDLEQTFGSKNVHRILGYITAAKHGLLDSEIADLLSCDDVSLEGGVSVCGTFHRVPPVIWIRIRRQVEYFMRSCLVNKLSVTHWWDSSVRATAELRYLAGDDMINISSALVDYYQSRWAEAKHTEHSLGREVDCLVLGQPLKYDNVYNSRKLNELPLHLYRSGRKMDQVMPWNDEWFLARMCGSDVYQLLEDLTLLESSPDLHLLQELLELSAYALAYDGMQIYSQIVARLTPPDPENHPEMAALYEWASKGPRPSLFPLETCLHMPGVVELQHDTEIYFDSLHLLKNSTTYMASLGADKGELIVWSIYEEKSVRTLSGLTQPRDIKMVDEDRGLVLCNREIKLYNMDEASFEMKLKGVMNQKMPFYGLHDSDHIVSLSRNRMYVNMTNLQTGDCVATFKVGEDRFLNSLLVSRNGKMCVCGDETQKPFPLLVWDLVSRKLVYDLRIPHHEFVTSLSAITNDGHYVVSVCKEVGDPSPNFIIVYDLQSGTLFKKWKPDVNTCSIAISSEGGCVISGLEDTTLLAWDLVTGACRFSLKGHCAPVDHIRVNESGDVCVTFDSTGRDRSIRMWNLNKGFCIAVFTPDSFVKCCELTPDGQAVVLGIQGRPNILTLLLCNGQTVSERLPQLPSFGNSDNMSKEVDLSNAG